MKFIKEIQNHGRYVVDTGESTQTGGRLAKEREYLDDTFCFTYGDSKRQHKRINNTP